MNRHYEKLADGTVKCIENEVPFEVPQGWVWCRLENLIELISGQDFSPEYYNDRQKGIPYITGASNMNDFNIIINRWTETPKSLAIKNDLLITCKGSGVGKMAFMDIEKAHIARQIMAIRSFNLTNRKYLFYFLQFSVGSIRANMNGLIPGIDRKTILNLSIPLPPFVEQYRIVLRIEELMLLVNQYDNYSIKLEQMETEFPVLLKKAILQYAIQGKLISQNPSDELASELLKRIRQEKEHLIKEKKIKRDKVDSFIFKGDDNKYYERIGKSTVCIDKEIPFEIPESWEWCRLKTILIINPRNKIEDDLEVSFVPMALISDGFNNMHESEKRIWESIKSGFTHFAENDIAIAKITPCFENLKSVIMKNLTNGYGAGTTELHVLRPFINTIEPLYLLYFCKSPYFITNGIQSYTGTAGQQRISTEYVANILFPLPPYKEQGEIIKTIELLLNKITPE